MWKKENLRRRRLYATKKKAGSQSARSQSTLRNGERLEERIVLNAAPVLDDTASPALLSIAEDAGVPVGQVGTLVSSLIDTSGAHSNFSDADGDLPGIAITGVNLQGGALWYSSDDGSTWLDVGAVSDEAPRLLAADATTRVYFEPAADFSGTVSDVISFKAWDHNVIWQQLGLNIDGVGELDQAGFAVSVSGDGSIVAIGGPIHDSYRGHVRVMKWSGVQWEQLGSDIDGQFEGDQAGFSLSLSADGMTLVVGAKLNDGNGNNAGNVRVFRWQENSWNQLGNDIVGVAADDQMGSAVSVSNDGSRIAVSARYHDASIGHVQIFEFDGTVWNQLGDDIDGESIGDQSGYKVSISGDGQTVAIGAPNNGANGASSGHVRAYRWSGAAWQQLGNDLDGEAVGDFSGSAISLSNDGQTLAIGGRKNNAGGSERGHVRVFHWSGSLWNQLGTDINGEEDYEKFGVAVSLSADGQRIAIGGDTFDGNGEDSGRTKVYQWSGDQNNWFEIADIFGESAGDQSGCSVSLNAAGNVLVIGGRYSGGRTGHVRIFQLVPSVSTVTDMISVDVTDVNDAPVNTLLATATTIVDQPIAFTSYRGNGISISDADAGSNPVEVTLSVDQGSISLINPNPGNALTYSAGDGSADATMTFQGTVADINTALGWVSYQPAVNRYFQWQVEDGGNGNWYQYVTDGLTWDAAKTNAENLGGHLATVTSAGERQFLYEVLQGNSVGVWLGGYQDRTAIDFEEPLDGWNWVTDEGWSYDGWASSEPNDSGGNEHYLSFSSPDGTFHDNNGGLSRGYLVEYSLDPRPANHLDATLTITTDDLGNSGVGGALVDTDSLAIEVVAAPDFQATPTHPMMPATLDDDFGVNGTNVLSITSGIDYIHDMTVLDDGKILAVGAVNDRFGIMRFNADMTLDNTFGSGGGTQVDFGAGVHAKSFAVDSSGRIVVIGGRGDLSGTKVVRFNPSGALDSTFGDSGSVTFTGGDNVVSLATPWDIEIRADGSIVVVGNAHNQYNARKGAVAACLDDVGSVRWTRGFSVQNHTYSSPYYWDDVQSFGSVLTRDDGRIILVGSKNEQIAVFEVDDNGNMLSRRGIDFGSSERVRSVLDLPDGRFLVIGISNSELLVSRHLSNGALDEAFGSAGSVKLPVLNGADEGLRATLAADGKILISGYAENGENNDLTVIRLNYEGSVDNSFGTNGSVAFDISGNDYGYAIASLADGKILVAGRAGNEIALVRLLGDSDQTAAAANEAPVNTVPGAQTTLVNQPLAFTDYRGNQISISDADSGANAVEVTLTADTGTITLLNPDRSGRLTYLAGDGTEDATMTFTGTVADINTALQWVSYRPEADYLGDATITITTDDLGNVGLGGAQVDTDTITVTSEAVPAFAVSPTHPTLPSALDTSLDSDGKQKLSITAGIDYIHDMTVLDDGKILAVGAVNDRFGIMRFNADMTLDNTFGSGGGTQVDFGAGVHAKSFAVDSSGRIVVIGGRGDLSGTKVVRFNPSGALDSTFGDSGSVTFTGGDNVVSLATPWDIEIRADGSIVVVGNAHNQYNARKGAVAACLDDVGSVRWTRGFSVQNHTYSSPYYWDDVQSFGSVLTRDDGRIILVGSKNEQIAVFEVDDNGNMLSRRGIDFGSSERVRSVLDLPDGRFLVIGISNSELLVSRHLSNGALDEAFGSAGSVKLPVLNGADEGLRATLAADGKILISGYAENGENNDLTVIRLNYEGSVDNSFGTNGSVAFDISGNDYGYAIASLADGKILVAGRAGNEIALVRLLGDSDQTAAAANEAPVNTVPGAQTTLVNQPLAFTDYRGNQISISDADSGANAVEVTLTADTGTITLLNPDRSGRLTYLAGDGTEDATMTFTGTVADINTALQWVSYRPEADYLGDATITITTDDLGNVGLGGAQVDTDTITVTSEAVPAFAVSPTHPTLPSALDTSLDSDGKQKLSITAGIDYIHDMTVLDDGKILAVGAVNDRFGIMRFNADMTLDNTFGSGGGTQVDFGAGVHAKSFAVDSSGRIVVIGGRGDLSGTKVVRFNPSGALDSTFGDSGSVTFTGGDNVVSLATPWDIEIRADGSIVVVGNAHNQYNARKGAVAACLDDVGSVRWTRGFSVQNHTYSSPYYWDDVQSFGSVLTRDDGRIILVGSKNEQIAVFEVDDNGNMLSRRGIDFGSSERVRSVLDLPDGRFLVIGISNSELLVSRHLSNGALDEAFGSAGSVKLPVLNGADEGLRATLAADGKILISGYAENGENNDLTVIRLNYEGSVDNSFGTNGSVAFDISGNDYGYAIASLADGKILVAGRAGNEIALVRLLGDSDQTAAAANEAPVNTVPGAQTTLVNQPLAFTDYRGNQISISDADSGANAVEVTLTADTGTITLLNPDRSGRLTYLAGDGTEDATMTFTGTVADINTAMEWVSFRPDAPVPSPYFQWTAESGGNDHWYEYVSTPLNWDAAQADAVSRGGTLATLTTEAETTFMASQELSGDLWIGGYQDRSGFTFSEPLAGWTWITGEAWGYANWSSTEPNNGGSGNNEHHLMYRASTSEFYDDPAETAHAYIIEYTSDPRSGGGEDSGHSLTITTNDLGSVGTGGAQSDTDVIAIAVSEPPAFAASPTHATLPATLDDSFDGDGIQVLALTPNVDYIHDMTVLDDGKILAVGAVNDRFGIMRFNADMTLDNTFGSGGGTQVDFGAGVHAKSFAVDSSGRIVVIGGRGDLSGTKVVRFNPSGALDSTFGDSGSVTFTGGDNVVSLATPWDIEIRADGSIVVVGNAHNQYNARKGAVAACLDDVGSVRWTRGFSVQNHTYSSPYYWDDVQSFGSVLTRDDGRIILVGSKNEQIAVFEVDDNGNMLSRRGIDFGSSERVRSVLDLPDGRFLVIGISNSELLVSRHLSNGALDEAFGSAGSVKLPVLNGADEGLRATLAADGKILISGYAENGENNDLTVIRLNYEGSVDNSFGTNGSVAFDISGNDYGYAIASLADGKILVAGRAGNEIALVRLLGDYDYVSNNQPTLDMLSDLEIDRDAAEQTISLSGITAGGENQVLRVTATSDNQSLIPDPAVTYTSPDTTGSLALTPAAGQMGTATITVTVEDAGNDDDFDATGDNASYVRTFVVTVAPRTDTPAVFTGDLTGIVASSGEATGAVAATDVDGITAGAPYELQLQAETGHAIVFGSTGQWVYVPGQEFDGSDTFTVRVTDDFGWTTDQVISVTGTPRSNNETLPDIYINQSTADQTASMQVPLVSVVSPPSGNLPTRVIAISSNAAIVPNPTTIYTSADVPGGLSFSPAIDQTGVVTINLSIEDGGPDKDLATAADNVFASQSFDITVLELLPNQGATALSKDGSEQLYAEAQPVMYQQQQVEVDIFGWQALGAEDDASGKSLLASRSGTTNRILTDDTWRIGSMFHDLTNETSQTLNEDARVQEFSLSTVVGAYVINGQQNPTLTLYRGVTYALNLNVPGHPFYLQTTNGSGYQSQHVYLSGFDGNGETTGTHTWTVPLDAPNELFYQCQLHAGMNGRIIISDLPSNGE